MREWYWYIARPNELFIDLDHPVGGPLRRLSHATARLRGAIAAHKLSVSDWYLYNSETPWHYHLMVRTEHDMSPAGRAMWEARLADDGYRHLMSLARLVATAGEHTYSLLIAPEIRAEYPRKPNFVCKCDSKHKGSTMEMCPIARIMHPVARLSHDHFGTPIYMDGPITTGRQEM